MILTTAVAVVVVAGGYWMLGGPEGKSTVDFATETVTKGNVSNFITATGTIEPVTEVEVGTQVSGIIDKIYVDYNSVVKKGELIAEMDKVTLQSELQSAKATYDGNEAEYDYQKKLYDRNRKLHEKQLISDMDYEETVIISNVPKVHWSKARRLWQRLSVTCHTQPSPRLSMEW